MKLVYIVNNDFLPKNEHEFLKSGNDELFYSVKQSDADEYAVAELQEETLICSAATKVSDNPIGMFYLISGDNYSEI